jgi:hypothetical protein
MYAVSVSAHVLFPFDPFHRLSFAFQSLGVALLMRGFIGIRSYRIGWGGSSE